MPNTCEILELYDNYNYINIDLLIVFYNCSDAFIGYLTTSAFLIKYILDKNNIVVINYNKELCGNIHNFYKLVFANTNENINSYAHEFSDTSFNCESHYIVHNNIFAELHIFYNANVTSYLSIDGMQVHENICKEFCNLDITNTEVYLLIINIIENHNLELAFNSIKFH